MSSEGTGEGAAGGRVTETLDRLQAVYDDAMAEVRTYTPYVVRTIEVVLALALLALLAHWLYWFSTAA